MIASATTRDWLIVATRLALVRTTRASRLFAILSCSAGAMCFERGPKLRGKVFAKHRAATLGFGPRGFVLKYVPVLSQQTVLNAHNIGGNPCNGAAIACESTMHNDVVVLGHDHARLVTELGGKAADQVEETLASGLDVCAVL